MSMDMTQASQMLRWLDEERRKDRALITALREQLDHQAEQIDRYEEQIAALQKSVATLETLPIRIAEFGTSLEQLRLELTNLMETREEHHRKEHREAERTRQLEIGALRDEVSRVADEIRAIPRLAERVEALATENARLNESTQRLDVIIKDQGQRFEDRLQTVVYLEEQRRSDHQRIVELEKTWSTLHKRIEAVSARLPLLEDAIPKMRTRIEEGLKPIQEFEGVVEELRVADFRRNQEVKRWLDQAAEVQAEVERMREERQMLLSDRRDVSEALRRLEPFQQRLEVRQNEALERQRVMEERLRRQWEEWQSKEEKERQNWEVGAEDRWRQQQELNARHQERLESIEPMLKFHHDQLVTLWETRRDDASRQLESAQAEYEATSERVDEQLAASREYTEPQKRV
jgi:chromosome segregation ATPase